MSLEHKVRQIIKRTSVDGGGKLAEPRAVIIDTDWWTDVDDVVAMRVALGAERQGLIDIMAITVNTALEAGPGSLDAILYEAGRPGVPIGAHKSYVPPGAPSYQSNMYGNNPHDIGPLASVPSGVDVLRRALAAGEDGAVDVISIGYLTNLQELLASAADSISALTGAALVLRKVRHLWVMGGRWPSGAENNFNRDSTAISAAAAVVATWPTPITFLGFEVGSTVRTGGNMTFDASSTDILRVALADHGSAGGRFSWDPMMMRLATVGNPTTAGYTTIQGTASVNATTGANAFAVSPSGPHRYVIKTKPDQWYIDDINPLLVIANWPALLSRVYPVGRAQPVLPSRSTTAYPNGLVVDIDVADLASLANGAAVIVWPNRPQARYGFRAPTSGTRPLMATGVGGRSAIKGDTTKRMITDALQMGQETTVYALVRWSALPASSQTVISADNTVIDNRGYHLKVTSAPIAQSANFIGAVGGTADGSTITVNTWQVIGFRANGAELQTFVDGVLGVAATRASANVVKSPIALYTRYFDSQSEGSNGYLAKARIYTGYHDQTTITAVTAELQGS